MKEEMDSLLQNQTWSLVDLPNGKRALTNKWVYILKEEGDGQKRYKAILMEKRFHSKERYRFW